MRTLDPTLIMYTPLEHEHGGTLKPVLLLVSDSISESDALYVMAISIGW